MRHPAFLAAFIVLLSSSFSGAAPDGSTLTGSVRTADGMALPQIVLTLRGPGGQQTVVSGPEGRFRVSGLTPGAYTVALDAPGFVLSSEARVEVGTAEVRLDLTVAPAPVREQVVVAATRGEAALSTLGVSATVLDADRVAEREPSTFLQLLESVPGVAVARGGGLGLQSSAFVRGGESRFARILIDGVPVNEPGGYYNFGSVLPLELERVEVVRGAASSLYGSDALAGVIEMVTRRAGPEDSAGAHAEAEGGGFGWRRGLLGTSGRRGFVDWNLGLQRLETDNEAPNNAFRETTGALALGAQLGETTSLRLIGRGQTGSVGTPGSTAFGRPDRDASYERDDLVLGGRLHHLRGGIGHDLRVGLARSRQLSLDPLDSGSYVPRSGDKVGAFPISDFPDPKGFQNDVDRLSAGYQAELPAGPRHLLTAGVDLERESGSIGARAGTLLSPHRTNVGGYVQDRIVAGSRVFLTLGGRLEHNDSYGTQVVPRAAVAARLRGGEDATTLRASGGAGIKEPSFFETFGVSFYAKGNPDLKPERSRTFDVGVEQRLFHSRLRAEATWFYHSYRDQIAYQIVDFTTFAGSYINLGRTRARGVELGVEAVPVDGLRFSALYTHLDGKVVVSNSDFDPVYAAGKPLLRRPADSATLSAHLTRGRVGGGVSLVLVGKRADSDFAGLNLTQNDGYARLDARVRVNLLRGLTAFAAAENLLDRSYQEILGYPALGRSVRAGLRFRSAARQ